MWGPTSDDSLELSGGKSNIAFVFCLWDAQVLWLNIHKFQFEFRNAILHSLEESVYGESSEHVVVTDDCNMWRIE